MMTTEEDDRLDTQTSAHSATIILTTTQQIDNPLACTDLTSMKVTFGVRKSAGFLGTDATSVLK